MCLSLYTGSHPLYNRSDFNICIFAHYDVSTTSLQNFFNRFYFLYKTQENYAKNLIACNWYWQKKRKLHERSYSSQIIGAWNINGGKFVKWGVTFYWCNIDVNIVLMVCCFLWMLLTLFGLAHCSCLIVFTDNYMVSWLRKNLHKNVV